MIASETVSRANNGSGLVARSNVSVGGSEHPSRRPEPRGFCLAAKSALLAPISPPLLTIFTAVGQFDEALDRRVFALREQSHVSDQTVAERRRTVPAQVRDLIADLLDRQRVAESAVPDSADDTLMQEDSDYCKTLPVTFALAVDHY